MWLDKIKPKPGHRKRGQVARSPGAGPTEPYVFPSSVCRPEDLYVACLNRILYTDPELPHHIHHIHTTKHPPVHPSEFTQPTVVVLVPTSVSQSVIFSFIYYCHLTIHDSGSSTLFAKRDRHEPPRTRRHSRSMTWSTGPSDFERLAQDEHGQVHHGPYLEEDTELNIEMDERHFRQPPYSHSRGHRDHHFANGSQHQHHQLASRTSLRRSVRHS
jgi:hypothetical protein